MSRKLLNFLEKWLVEVRILLLVRIEALADPLHHLRRGQVSSILMLLS